MTRVAGWAIDANGAATLDIFVNSDHVARIRCDRVRPDIAPAIEGAALETGFSFAFPSPLRSSDLVSIRFVDGQQLGDSPLYPTVFDGHVDYCTTSGLAGWATCENQPTEVDVFVNDEWLLRVSCRVQRPDLAALGIHFSAGFNVVFPQLVLNYDLVTVCFPDGSNLIGSPRYPAATQDGGQPVAPPGSDYDVASAKAILASEFVDETLFVNALGGKKADDSAVERYLATPLRARPELSWFFDGHFYARKYPDITQANLDPLIHFLAFGIAELRDPHPLIDISRIAGQFSGAGSPFGVPDLLFYLTSDAGDPSSRFSTAYYRAQLPDQPGPPGGLLLHFLRRGIQAGLKPAPGASVLHTYQAQQHKHFDIRDAPRQVPVPAQIEAPGNGADQSRSSACSAPMTLVGRPADRVHLYCLSLNEERTLPFFLRHYRDLVDRFFIYDNGSTDTTLSLLAKEQRVSVTRFQTEGDSFVEQEQLISDQAWKQSRGRTQWVIFVDIDEFLHHPNLPGYLYECTRRGISAIDAIAYDMVSDRFPPADSPLTESVTHGLRNPIYDKLCIFDPNAITCTNFAPGRHSAAPTGRVRWPSEPELKLLHYKRLGVDHVVQRYATLRKGLRSRDLENRWGVQYLTTRKGVEREFRDHQRKAAPVPGLGVDKEIRLMLWVDGKLLGPAEVSHNTYTYLPPIAGQEFRLVSNGLESPSPRHPGWVSGPPGIPIARIFLRSKTAVYSVALDCPELLDGWSELAEPGSGGIRWMTGNALLPVSGDARPVTAIEVTVQWPASPFAYGIPADGA